MNGREAISKVRGMAEDAAEDARAAGGGATSLGTGEDARAGHRGRVSTLYENAKLQGTGKMRKMPVLRKARRLVVARASSRVFARAERGSATAILTPTNAEMVTRRPNRPIRPTVLEAPWV